MKSKAPHCNSHHYISDRISKIPPLFIELLKSRGIVGDEAAHKFLYPSLADLKKPEQMKNLREAVQLVVSYILADKQIIIWGDYDVDGTTGTALLINFLRELGIEANWHIPDRMNEGYGLNSEWFFDRKNTRLSDDFLLITVDCGISNAHQVELIKKIGGKIIITDHHSLPEQALPDCLILNPCQSICGFHRDHLAGVGVAFYLAAGIRAKLSHASTPYSLKAQNLNLKQYLAFVAIGTVADIVELTTTNRILVRAGLEALAEPKFPGLKELLLSCDITDAHISSEDIGFLIGPKINAAGRLGQSRTVVELFTEQDRKTARQMASQLTELNKERKRISAENLESTLMQLHSHVVEREKCAIVKGSVHQGVAGIVASRLVEIFGVPAIVFAKNEQADGDLRYTGSVRSVEGVNIMEILTQCSGFIEKFGGHRMAAGLTVCESKINDFEISCKSLIHAAMAKREVAPKSRFDICCAAEVIMNRDYLQCIRLLEPFGPGNLQPIFQDPAATIVDSRTVGRAAEHLQVTIRGRYSNLKGIGFSLGYRLTAVQEEPRRNMLFTPTMNRFRGNVSWQVRVIDI